jgi:outer membrane immunogenic protein
MRKNIFVLFAAGAFVSAPAAAANFTGPRAEVRGGWDRTTIDLSVDDMSGSGHKDGFNLGAEVGYDASLGAMVVAGAYAGVEFATTKACSEVYGDDEACLKLGRNFTLGARLGAKVSPQAMLYVKGGYSNGQLKATYKDFIDPTYSFSAHANRDGFHFGGGVELAVGPNGYVRAEYVRTNYDDYNNSDFGVKIDAHRDQALLGFGLRF